MEILEINDLTIETTEMSVNRNAFMKWVDDNDSRRIYWGKWEDELDWNEYFESPFLKNDLQQYITETFSRNQSQLQLTIK